MSDVGLIYRNSNSWQKSRWDELLNLFFGRRDDLDKPNYVLDLGCGTGERSVDFVSKAKSIKKILALDSNKSMIDIAEKENSHLKILYRLMDIENVDQIKVSYSFDTIIANYSLHWLKNKDNFFKKLNKMTSRKANLLIGTVEHLPNMLQTIDNYMVKNRVGAICPYFFLSSKEWKELLEKNGWIIISEVKKSDSHTVKSGITFLEEWYSASTNRAFYGKKPNKEDAEISNLISLLNDDYGVDGSARWKYSEETYLCVVQKDD